MISDLRQMVWEPTRGEYLLDLILSDLEECNAKVHAKIADHNMVEASFQIPFPKQRIIKREVWHFKNAAWNNFRSELFSVDWQILRQGTVDEPFNLFPTSSFSCAQNTFHEIPSRYERKHIRGLMQHAKQQYPERMLLRRRRNLITNVKLVHWY